MIAEVVHDDAGKPLGMVIQGENAEEKGVLAKYHREGMMAVSYSDRDGLVVIFGRPFITPPPKETEAEDIAADPNPYVG